MLFDLYNVDKNKEYEYWVNRVHVVASVLNYDYFKLWDLPEVEFEILEKIAIEEISVRKSRLDEIKERRSQ
jgi:hypothetical protein